VPHMPVSVRELDCDFLAFSGHKMCAPMGIGVLWARPELLERMPPFLGGGSMISRVTLERTTYNVIPHRFEAGTPDVAGAVGLEAACDYLDGIGRVRIQAHEQALTRHLLDMLDEVCGVSVYGPRDVHQQGGVASFNVDGVHAHDVGTILDRHGVAIRAGHHCCQPLMQKLGVAATNRASFYLYTIPEEIDQRIARIKLESLGATVDHLTEPHMLEFGAYEGAALARLHVLEVDDDVGRVVEDDPQALLELRRRDLHRSLPLPS